MLFLGSLLTVTGLLGASVLFYGLAIAVYNVCLHPLRKFPGPKLWATSFIFRHAAAMRGDLDWTIKRFHETYGEVVRFSPEELSFTNERAWRDIYGHKAVPLAKDPLLYNSVKLSDGASSIFNASSEAHPLIRKQLAFAFSDKALRQQEPLLQSYIDLLMRKLRDTAHSGTPADLVRWYNFTTFDLIGDLSIGKSFGCLHDNEYHTWVRGLTEGTKIGPYIRTVATYTDIKWLWRVLAPERIKQARMRHESYVKNTAAERMAQGVMEERKDFLSYILKNRDEKTGLTDAEVTANAGFLIIAGSEAASTAMSGITFWMAKTPRTLQLATNEVREAFSSETEIDFASTATRLPYLAACISEGMRAFPPGPTIPPRRTTPGKTMTSIAGYDIPGWVSVGVHPLSTTHSPDNFCLPDEFIPERWLPSATQDPSSPYYNDRRDAVQPFSVGPRSCLGKSLAYNEMRVILARMLWNFDLALSADSLEWHRQATYTLWEKKPLMVQLYDVRSGPKKE